MAVVPTAAFAQNAVTPSYDTPASTPTGSATITPALLPVMVHAPNRRATWAGRLLTPVPAWYLPGRRGRKMIKAVQPVAPLGAGPVWLEVRGVRDVRGERWVKVLLPVRPNGTTAWMRADAFDFREFKMQVDIDLGDRRLTLVRSGRPIARFPLAVGAPSTPTPTGSFAIAEIIPTGDPSAFLGPIVMPLVAFSNVLNEFAGGNGRVAIHGTSQPALIGTRASHGCMRMRNADILTVSRMVSPGMHVRIHD